MAIEIRVPTLGESITEATVGKWFKKAGESGAGRRAAGGAGDRQGDARGQRAESGGLERDCRRDRSNGRDRRAARPGRGRRGDPGASAGSSCGGKARARVGACRCDATPSSPAAGTAMPPAPAAAKIAAEDKIDLASIAGSGKRGQVLKGDVLAAVAAAQAPAPVVALRRFRHRHPRRFRSRLRLRRPQRGRRPPMTALAKSGCA